MQGNKSNGLLRTGVVAALLGVSPAALRLLEERGSIPAAPRDGAGRRFFGPALVKDILNCRRLPGEREQVNAE
jgi:DNA-binding transcriptional MerR regulator